MSIFRAGARIRSTRLLPLIVLLISCGDSAEPINNHALTVVTRNSPTSYFIDRDKRPSGPEHDLVQAFAASQNRSVSFIIEDTLSDVLQTLADGKADIAAAGLSLTDARQSRFLFTRSYRKVKQQLVCRRGGDKAKSPAQLKNVSLEVIADSAYIAALEQLKLKHPAIKWTVNPIADTEQLLQKVWLKKVDCTLADSNIVAVNRRYLPELLVMFNLHKAGTLAWALPPDASPLKKALDSWLTSKAGKEALNTIEQRYYSFIDDFDYVDTRALVRRIEQRLPKYRKLFEQSAREHGI
ncbi:MAG: membrane-bound lytic murein transglycosylase F, partial [Bermanella sp.]